MNLWSFFLWGLFFFHSLFSLDYSFSIVPGHTADLPDHQIATLSSGARYMLSPSVIL